MILQISDERAESKVREEEAAELTCPCGHMRNTVTCGRIHTEAKRRLAIRHKRCVRAAESGGKGEEAVGLGPAVLGECQRQTGVTRVEIRPGSGSLKAPAGSLALGPTPGRTGPEARRRAGGTNGRRAESRDSTRGEGLATNLLPKQRWWTETAPCRPRACPSPRQVGASAAGITTQLCTGPGAAGAQGGGYM